MLLGFQEVWSLDGSRRPQLSAAASLSASKSRSLSTHRHTVRLFYYVLY